MRLVDQGPDRVLIYPEIEVEDDYGTPRPVTSPTPVTVHTYVQELSATEAADYDLDPRTSYYFNTAQPVPAAGAWARVEWDGREWDVVGEPVHRGRTHRTAYTHVVIVARHPQHTGKADL